MTPTGEHFELMIIIIVCMVVNVFTILLCFYHLKRLRNVR